MYCVWKDSADNNIIHSCILCLFVVIQKYYNEVQLNSLVISTEAYARSRRLQSCFYAEEKC